MIRYTDVDNPDPHGDGYQPLEVGDLIATPHPHGNGWLEVVGLPAEVPASLEPGSTANRAYPGFWCAAVPPAFVFEAPTRSRLGFVALVCAIAMFASGCWTGTIVDTRAAPAYTSPERKPRRYPSRIHTLDCQGALERLATFDVGEEFAECVDPDEDWFVCAFRVREPLWYELNRYAYQVVDECAPEAWKVITVTP